MSKWLNVDQRWRPGGDATPLLPPGAYRVALSMEGIFLVQQQVSNDGLLLLPDTATSIVAANIRRFWESEALFKRLGLAYKRGVLFHGAPGTGKTACISLLANELIAAGGIVLVEPNPALAREGIRVIRSIEAARQLICILEDIESQIREHEETLLSLLSGQDETTHVVFMATTNSIEALPGRLKNRPSRFDEVVETLPPSPAARAAYFISRVPGDLLPDYVREQWVTDTEGFTIAHLRELIVGVIAMGRGYHETLARLRAMMLSPDDPQPRRRDRGHAVLAKAAEVFGMSTKALGEEQ